MDHHIKKKPPTSGLHQPSSTGKTSYHHGNLAEALVDAATVLLKEHSPEKFTLADASRVAGVSKGAPYRHFDSKEDLLREVVHRGFDRLAEVARRAVEDEVPGSDERIVAVGLSYIAFATAEPALFRLMFGSQLGAPVGDQELPSAFGVLISELAARTGIEDLRELLDIGRPLWTLVHGASMLTIDNNYQRVDPGGDTEDMIRQATRLILAPYPERI